MDQSVNLKLPYVMPYEVQKHLSHNEAIARLDALVQLAVLDRDLATPPGSPAEGSRYLVAAAATGAWSGWTGSIAHYVNGAWERAEPRIGWLAYVVDESALLSWNGSAWVGFSGVSATTVPFAPAGNIAATSVQAALEELDAEKAAFSTGTWTPRVTFGGSATGLTYASRYGWWYRLGNIVIAHANMQLSAKGSSTGVAVINDLPFPSVNKPNYLSIGGSSFASALNSPALGGLPGALVGLNTSSISLYVPTTTGTGTMTDVHLSSNSFLYPFVIYEAQ